MRFLSSSALASAPKLRLAANCSAAETIGLPCPPPPLSCPRKPASSNHDPLGKLGARKRKPEFTGSPAYAGDDTRITPLSLRLQLFQLSASPCLPSACPRLSP